MTTVETCPDCGFSFAPTDAVSGMCPRCLIGCVARSDETRATQSAEPESGARFSVPSVADLQPHFEQYEIVGLIGYGGMSAVYKVRQKSVGRFVALKILPKEVAEAAGGNERFAREIGILAGLSHPNIITLLDAGQTAEWCYCTMEYVRGPNLRQLMGEQRLSASDVLKLVPDICDGLQYAHDQGIVHRDIKPENILIDEFGRAKIADFGLAKIFAADSATWNTLTQHVVGTPRYMAPEQIDRPTDVDHRADLYALGVMIYEMLTGHLPAVGSDPPSTDSDDGSVKQLDSVVMKAVAGKPERRYQSARDVRADLLTAAASKHTEQEADRRTPWWRQLILPSMSIVLLVLGINLAMEALEQFHRMRREAFLDDTIRSQVSRNQSILHGIGSAAAMLASFILARVDVAGLKSWSDAFVVQKLTAPILYAGYCIFGIAYALVPAIAVLAWAGVPLFAEVNDWAFLGTRFSHDDKNVGLSHYWLVAVSAALATSASWLLLTASYVRHYPCETSTLVSPAVKPNVLVNIAVITGAVFSAVAIVVWGISRQL